MNQTTKDTSDVVVIGGGVVGLSTALQLAKRGCTVRVVERMTLGSGSTGRAAGLLGQLRGTHEHTRMLMASVRLVQQLEQEAQTHVYCRTGSLRLGATPARAEEIQALVAMGQSIGLDIDHLPIDEVQRRMPYMRTDDLLDACFCPSDGHLRPQELVDTYVALGRQLGVVYHEHCATEQILVHGGRAIGVKTPRGRFEAAVVVNAGGPWSYLLAELADQQLPVAAVKHHYFVTHPQADQPIDEMSPAIRDRHHAIYSRPERGGLLVGMYGAAAVGVDVRNLPRDFRMAEMPHAPEHFDLNEVLHCAQQRFPWITPKTPLDVTTGIMTFTPDGRPFCGQLPEVAGLYHCAGFNGHGIVQSPAIGLIMAQLIVDGATEFDLTAIDADRFANCDDFRTREQIERACLKMYGDYYGKVETPTAA